MQLLNIFGRFPATEPGITSDKEKMEQRRILTNEGIEKSASDVDSSDDEKVNDCDSSPRPKGQEKRVVGAAQKWEKTVCVKVKKMYGSNRLHDSLRGASYIPNARKCRSLSPKG